VGNSNIRNPVSVSCVAKGLLHYHGLGGGITRALTAWPTIDFASDHEACLFTATVHRQVLVETVETSGKRSRKILSAVRQNRQVTIPDLAALIGIFERSVERNIQKLQDQCHLRRIGPAKGGHWEVVE